jgi:hypothetical protein
VASCAAACSTDLGAARSALEAGDYQGAFDLYRCADNTEAAFGAGLTRTLLAFEGKNADALLAVLGEPPLPATDVFGADGVLGRSAARWTGQGNLTLSGALQTELTFDRAMHEVSDDVAYSIGTVRAEDRTSASHATFSLSLNTDPTAAPFANGAVLAVTNECNPTYVNTNLDPRLGWLDLEFDAAGTSYYCELPYSIEASQCQPDGGSVVVTQAASAPGQPAGYEFRELVLQCYAPSTDDSSPSVLVRMNGTLSMTAVSEQLDTSGLHPLFGSDHSLRVPVGTVLTDALRHGGSAAAELEEAACFFKLAAQGSGSVYTIPGVLFGGSDVPMSKGRATSRSWRPLPSSERRRVTSPGSTTSTWRSTTSSVTRAMRVLRARRTPSSFRASTRLLLPVSIRIACSSSNDWPPNRSSFWSKASPTSMGRACS